jgi:hypothetical protein
MFIQSKGDSTVCDDIFTDLFDQLKGDSTVCDDIFTDLFDQDIFNYIVR